MEGAAIMCAMLLLSPMSSKQHFCSLLVPIAFCVADYLYRRRSWYVAFALGLVFALGTLAAKDIIGRPLGNQLLAYGSLTICTLSCLLATGFVLISGSRSRHLLHQSWQPSSNLAHGADTRSESLSDAA